MIPTATTLERSPQAPENNSQTTTQMLSLADQKKKEIEETICQIFHETQEQNPGASWHRLTVMVAAQTGYSPEWIKKLLQRCGIENPQKRS